MRSLYILLACSICLVACRGDEPKRMPDTLPDIHGTITTINTHEGTAQISVKAPEAPQQKYPEASIKVNKSTLIEDEDGRYLKTAHLQQGQTVQVWFEGEVMESMPVQVTAKAVRVQKRPK